MGCFLPSSHGENAGVLNHHQYVSMLFFRGAPNITKYTKNGRSQKTIYTDSLLLMVQKSQGQPPGILKKTL